MNTLPKYTNSNGLVAILYSPGYGAGWFTWNKEYPAILFDPDIVQLILDDKRDQIIPLCTTRYPNGYFGGAETLTIEWLPPGTCFYINEYAGYETVKTTPNLTFIS